MSIDKCVDREFAEKTVRLWEMDDLEFIHYVTSYSLRAIYSSALNRTYGLRSRIPSLHHLILPGFGETYFEVSISSH